MSPYAAPLAPRPSPMTAVLTAEVPVDEMWRLHPSCASIVGAVGRRLLP